jgi:lipopolysaccharide export system permease protein
MYRESEMTIWFASGVGLSRFVRPVLGTSWPVLLVVMGLWIFVWPWSQRQSAELRERFEKRSDLSRVAPGQFQTSSDGQRTFFFERDPSDNRTGRNVFILSNQGDAESVVTARSGHIQMEGDDRYLLLDQGQRNEQNRASGEKTLSRFDSYKIEAGERVLSDDTNLPPKARPTIELIFSPGAQFQGELVWRLGLVLGCCNFLLLGIGLAANNPRRANNLHLVLALLTFVVYYNIINLTQAWVGAGKVGLGTALIGAHGGAFVLSLGLLWWRDHRRTVTRQWRINKRRQGTPS